MLKLNIRLKEVLKERNMTQMQLSEKSGVNQARISQLCKNGRQEVNLLMLEKIAHALDIKDISILLQFEEENN
ncbi:helix-turn-helix domain-containing protein [Paenibacillus peoriae]|uniref:helix-turn-helix domain-containing protein n=1 Tax=Paenibacillus TaxID=44249 RepID=UPI001F302ECA|nr:helix-turn-helix transcriptional regulator [Paenibacillus sp. MZ03-122A]MCF2719642.1 helix-turn-helix transcriptional regulator [Paenibacillus sp. UKAQ_18]MCP3779140.1 helix-turn-helix transcriptional regulator [Paenibacillus sp. MZ03-122A]